MSGGKTARGILVVAALFLLSIGHVALAQTRPRRATPADSPASLRASINRHISQPRFAPAAWGIKVVSLDTGETIYEHNPGKYFSPASNAKLYIAALALDVLGGEHRVRTSLYTSTRPDGMGTLKGDLIIFGRGDPTIAARFNDGDYFKGLEPLAARLVEAGVRRIDGDIIADESFFRGPPVGRGWEWDDLQWHYGAEVSALSINDNALDLSVRPGARPGLPCDVSTGPPTSYVTIVNRTTTGPAGSAPRVSVYRPVGGNTIHVSGRLPAGGPALTRYVAVANPAALFGVLFRDVLLRRGVSVAGEVRSIGWREREENPVDYSGLIELAFIESRPLGNVVRETMKSSQNLWAQLLLLQAGSLRHSQPSPAGKETDASTTDPFVTTEELGIEVLNEFVVRAGIKPGQVLLEEGSGLSRKSLITPEATVTLLRYMSRHPQSGQFMASLPVAGVDGTLQYRMRETAAAGQIRAKTGTLRYVHTLSGYATTASGERLAFSIMLNNYFNPDRSVAARDEIDSIAIMLAGFRGRSTARE